MRRALRRVWYLLRQGRFEADLAEEMAAHRAMAEHDASAAGASSADARTAARRAFGSPVLAQDRSRDVWIPPLLQDITGDIRFAARLLRKDLGFTVAATMTLALGIGTAGTIFTIFDGMFLKGLPVDQPDRIVTVRAVDRQRRPLQLSLPQFADWQAAARSFKGLAAYTGASTVLGDEGQPAERVPSSYVSANAFAVIGERPILGRVFNAADDERGAPHVILIGEGIWRERYGADPHIIGRLIRVNGEPIPVIGVMPARFRFPVIDKAWLPLAMAPQLRDRRDARVLSLVGRLADGLGIPEAQGELDAIALRLGAEYPDTDAGLRAAVLRYTAGFQGFGDPWSDSLLASAFLLLIGCVNVGTLLLARAAGRERDLAIRTALGATSWRIVRQLVVESTLLAAVAASAGFGLTVAGVRLWIFSMPASNWPYWFRWEIDGRVVAFLSFASASTAALAGFAPAIHLSGAGVTASMKDDVRSGTTGRRGHHWTSGMIAGELALTLVLLACAGLMVRTSIRLLQVDRIVDSPHVLLANLQLQGPFYSSPEQRTRFVDAFAARLKALPTIQSATVATAMPFYTAPLRAVAFEARPQATGGPAVAASYVSIGPDYFETLGVHLLLGRVFDSTDGTAGHLATIVNQQFVRMYFSGQSPLGARVQLSDPNAGKAETPWLTIVGVSPTIRQHYGEDLDPVAYVPYRHDPSPVPVVLVRTSGDPARAAPDLRQAVHALDSSLVVFNTTPLEQLMAMTGFANRVFLTFFNVFAGFALLLSAIGLYATTRHTVTERRHEIGVRMTLGAQASQVVWLFTGRVLVLLGIGALVGLAGALAGTRLMRKFLVDTSPSDPVTMVSTTVLLVIVTLAATVLPALQALRVDPALTLRCE